MPALYVVEQGVFLSKAGERIVVKKGGKIVQSVQAHKIDRVILFGAITLSPPMTAFLLSKGIDTVFLSKNGKFRGRLVATMSKNIDLRQAQFRRMDDSNFVLDSAKEVVRGKL